MIRPALSYILSLLFLLSCSAEKINLSPINSTAEDIAVSSPHYSLRQKKALILYSSEITNLVASFPKFKNDAVNREVARMSQHLKNFVAAMENYDQARLRQADLNFQNSYKKLQKLRRYLNKDEDQVLNRYLVRIKTNISLLQQTLKDRSTS